MNAKTTVLLLVLLLALGGYAVFFELDRETTRQRESRLAEAPPSRTPLLDPAAFSLDAVTRIELRRNGNAFTLVREGDPAAQRPGAVWWQTRPVRFPLRRIAVEDLARAAIDAEVHSRFAPGVDGKPTAAELGFDEDGVETSITLVTEGERGRTVELGKRGMRRRAYVRFADELDRVYVIDDALHRAAIGADAADFRLRHTEPQGFALPDQADAFTLVRGDQRIELHRIDGRWFLNANATERADADAADDAVAAAGELRIERFLDGDPESFASYGLETARLRVRVEADVPGETETDADTTRTHELHIGGPADLDETRFFARWSIDGEALPVVFTVRDDSIAPLEVDADDLRDPAVVLSEPGELSEVRLERGGEAVVHVRRDEGGRWRFAPDVGVAYEADASRVRRWIESLGEMETVRYAPPAEGAEPGLRLDLYAGGRRESVRLYERGEELWAVRNNEAVAGVLSAEASEPMRTDPLALRDRTLLSVDPSSLSGIRIEQPDGASFRLTRSEQGDDADAAADPGAAWRLNGAAAFERGALEALLDELQPLEVERWLAQAVSLGEGGVIEWTLVTQDGSTRRLRVDPETGRGTADFESSAFVLPRSVIDALQAEFRDRTVLSLAGDEVAAVTVRPWEGDAFTIRREGDSFASSRGSVEEQAAAALFDRASKLRVERHVSGPVGQRALTTLAIETAAGRSHELQLAEPFEQKRVLHVDDRGWYRVSEAVAADLLGVMPERGGGAPAGE